MDPQVLHNELFSITDHPVAGRIRETRPAARFGRTPAVVSGPAPMLGEHTDEALRERGRTDDESTALHASGALG